MENNSSSSSSLSNVVLSFYLPFMTDSKGFDLHVLKRLKTKVGVAQRRLLEADSIIAELVTGLLFYSVFTAVGVDL